MSKKLKISAKFRSRNHAHAQFKKHQQTAQAINSILDKI